MAYSPAANSRPIYLTREGGVFRLSFPYRADIVERMRELPYASFDQQTKSWTCAVCQSSVDQLRRLYFDGLTDVSVDDLLHAGEQLPVVKQAMLRAGSTKRPFVVHMATRDDHLYSRLRAIPGAQWDKTAQAISYPPQAAAALAELAERGVVDDAGSLLKPADVVVTFDGRTGRFSIIGDQRAQPVFDRHFPRKDVVDLWQSKGIDVAFSDAFTEEIYRAELVRVGDGIQPAAMTIDLYPYQRVDVAFAVARTGSGVLHSPGVGKTPVAIGAGCELLERGEASRVVFVCPSAIRTQVAREIVRFTTYTADDVVVIGGSKKKRHEAYERAATASWLVVHYDVLSRDADLLKDLCAGALIVFDEAHKCFPAGTSIATTAGPVPIERIVEDDLRPEVWAYDEDAGAFVARQVTAVMRHGTTTPLVEVAHERGSFRCTADHPVYTEERGYVEASELASADTLLLLPGAVPTADAQPEVLPTSVRAGGEAGTPSAANVQGVRNDVRGNRTAPLLHGTLCEPGAAPTSQQGRGHLPAVPGCVHRSPARPKHGPLLLADVLVESQLGGGQLRHGGREASRAAGCAHLPDLRRGLRGEAGRGEQGPEVLHRELRSDLQDAGTRSPGDVPAEHPEGSRQSAREAVASVVAPDAGEQPHGGPSDACQGGRGAPRADVPGSRGQRDADCPTEELVCCAERRADGTRDHDDTGVGSVRVPADALQGRCGAACSAAGDRGRRQVTPEPQVAVPGPPQGSRPERARVVGVAVLERGHPRGAGDGAAGDPGDRAAAVGRDATDPYALGATPAVVYNLEVDGLNNYVADGVLVHNCKNPQSQRTKAAKKLARVAARRIVMSGTPVENDPGEWYSIMGQLAVPGSLGTPHEFFNRYQYPGRFGGYEGARNLPELKQRSQVHYTRRLKSEIAEHLPPLRVQQIFLDPDPAYAAALKRAHREARDEIAKGRVAKAKASSVLWGEDAADAEAGAEMTAVGMLRAMCSSPRLLELSDSEAATAMADAGLIVDADGPKLDELRVLTAELRYAREQRLAKMAAEGRTPATANEVTGERVVVFTYSRKMADLIAERLREDGISHRTYHGGTSQEDRDAAVEAFTDPDADITALVCTDAAAEGLNLGRCCNLLVNFDVPWNPSTLIQRGNRIHRVDGTAPHYLVLNYTVAGTIENGILKMLERKADLADAILGEAGGRAATTGRRTSNDVAELLREAFEAVEAADERDADGRKVA